MAPAPSGGEEKGERGTGGKGERRETGGKSGKRKTRRKRETVEGIVRGLRFQVLGSSGVKGPQLFSLSGAKQSVVRYDERNLFAKTRLETER